MKQLFSLIWKEIKKNAYASSKAVGSCVWLLAGILLVYQYTEARFSAWAWWLIFGSCTLGSYYFARREWEA